MRNLIYKQLGVSIYVIVININLTLFRSASKPILYNVNFLKCIETYLMADNIFLSEHSKSN